MTIFAGTSRRLFAFLVDITILNLVFLACYIVMKGIGYQYLEYWQVFLILFFTYFLLGDSLLLGGQSFGKRRLRIKVVKESGGLLGLAFAMLRSFYCTVVWFFIPLAGEIKALLSYNVSEVFTLVFITLLGKDLGNATM